MKREYSRFLTAILLHKHSSLNLKSEHSQLQKYKKTFHNKQFNNLMFNQLFNDRGAKQVQRHLLGEQFLDTQLFIL